MARPGTGVTRQARRDESGRVTSGLGVSRHERAGHGKARQAWRDKQLLGETLARFGGDRSRGAGHGRRVEATQHESRFGRIRQDEAGNTTTEGRANAPSVHQQQIRRSNMEQSK
jgi:hypothetical protein